MKKGSSGTSAAKKRRTQRGPPRPQILDISQKHASKPGKWCVESIAAILRLTRQERTFQLTERRRRKAAQAERLREHQQPIWAAGYKQLDIMSGCGEA